MSSINIPKRPAGNSGQMMSLLGAGAGAALGGPAGAGLGMQAGGMLGAGQQQPQGPGAVEASALSRRQAELDNSPQMQIRNSIDSLKYIEDPQQRMELAKPLIQAEMASRKGGSYAG